MADPLLLRTAVLQDAAERLRAAAIPEVGDHVFVARAAAAPPALTPCILLYSPGMTAQPLGVAWEWPAEVTLTLEIQCCYEPDAFSIGNWAGIAEAIGWNALAALLGDAAWRRLWRGPPLLEFNQFLQDGDNADALLVGETITMRLKPRAALKFPLIHEPLTGVDIGTGSGVVGGIFMVRADGATPEEPDVRLNIEEPS
ncbi:hypothetical protein FACS1894205_6050 [Alphaproteobacteria bacterium]|nr:hypothetical protein FACS1894205_6050 [Alphaproteobacteria bacterium]